jgi:CheY-like chemotaxis protein
LRDGPLFAIPLQIPRKFCGLAASNHSGPVFMTRHALLCVDDDPGIRQLYELLLGSNGYEILLAADARQGLHLLRSRNHGVDAVITDYEMPGMNGVEFANEVKRRYPDLPILMMSGSAPSDEETMVSIDATLPKGTSVHKIVEQIEQLLVHAHQVPPIPLSRLMPLGSVLAGVAVIGFLAPKLWK